MKARNDSKEEQQKTIDQSVYYRTTHHIQDIAKMADFVILLIIYSIYLYAKLINMVKTIVLVHGFWADSSSDAKIYDVKACGSFRIYCRGYRPGRLRFPLVCINY